MEELQSQWIDYTFRMLDSLKQLAEMPIMDKEDIVYAIDMMKDKVMEECNIQKAQSIINGYSNPTK